LRVKAFILLFISCLAGPGLVTAQVTKVTQLYYHIGEKDGLADNMVNCFVQDYRGIMWMGTQNGLSSFDGSEIRTWRSGYTNSDQQFFDNNIRGIAEDREHRIWLATPSGLSCFDTETKKIHSWHSNLSDDMRKLVCDGSKVWIATGYGLVEFDTRTNVFTHHLNKTSRLENAIRFNNDCNSIFLDSKKHLWLATVNGLWLFDPVRNTFEQYDSPKNDPYFDKMVNTVFEDHQGNVWVGCWSNGLKQVDMQNRTVKSFTRVAGMPHHIMSITEQQTGKGKYSLWLSGFLTDLNVTEMQAHRHDLKPIAQAASLEPRCLFISRDNLLWISTAKGVYILDPSRQLFNHYFIDQDNITDQSPAFFAKDKHIWIGGDKNFALKLFDDDFNLLKDYTPAIHGLKDRYNDPAIAVVNITPDTGNNLLLSTTSGILNFNTITGKINVVCNTFIDGPVKASGFINNVMVTRHALWCFPWRRGVWQFDQNSGKFHPLVVKLPEAPGILKNLNLQDGVTDSMGNIWIADLDYGVVKYTASTKTFARFITPDIPGFSRTINISYIKNKLWLMANANVVTIDPQTGKTRSWPLPAGMSSSIYDYTNDEEGNIWIATRKGLIVFNTHNYSFNQYTEEDGLVNNNMDGAIKKLPSGRMVYAGENYFTTFRPADLLRTPAHKTLLLTGITAGDTDLLAGNPKKVIVPAGVEKITFKWALLNYTNPLQNRYYSKLDKIDNDWNYAGNKGQIEYNSLPPGDYKFKYKAVTSDGLAGDEKVLLFTVEPAFWQTWWFIALMVLLLVATVLLIVRNVKLKERKRAALQLQLSALEMKALRAQMNPHFIFNALNSIQECIITKNTDTAYSYLSSFSKLVRMILENSEKQFISLEDEIETLRLYLSIEKLRFDDSFEYKIVIAPQVDVTFVRLPAMIIQPFVENALWHGLIQKKGEKKLLLSFRVEVNSLICVVKDNGVGRKHTEQTQNSRQIKKQSMGVKITEERLQLLETEASIRINDMEDRHGQPCGTEVTITIPLAF